MATKVCILCNEENCEVERAAQIPVCAVCAGIMKYSDRVYLYLVNTNEQRPLRAIMILVDCVGQKFDLVEFISNRTAQDFVATNARLNDGLSPLTPLKYTVARVFSCLYTLSGIFSEARLCPMPPDFEEMDGWQWEDYDPEKNY